MNNYYTLTVELTYKSPAGGPLPTVSEDVNAVVAHLHDVLDADDLMVLLDKVKQTLRLSMLVEASQGEAPETTIGKGLGAIRTALHFTGVGTPIWPLPQDFAFCAISLDKAAMPNATPDQPRELVPA